MCSFRVILDNQSRPSDDVLTFDAAYRLYWGNGMEATPDETFKITPFPLNKQEKNNYDFTFVCRTSVHYIECCNTFCVENLFSMPGRTILHIWKKLKIKKFISLGRKQRIPWKFHVASACLKEFSCSFLLYPDLFWGNLLLCLIWLCSFFMLLLGRSILLRPVSPVSFYPSLPMNFQCTLNGRCKHLGAVPVWLTTFWPLDFYKPFLEKRSAMWTVSWRGLMSV